MIKNGFKIFAGVLITILLSVVMSLPAAASTRNGFDELHIRSNTNDELTIRKRSSTSKKKSRNYESKNSYDEFHTAPTDIPANDGYKSGNFDELHINENYRQNVWHPENRGSRMNGFDEFHYPDEL